MGVTTFAQIAQWTERDVEDFDTRLEDFHGRVRRDDWIYEISEPARTESGFLVEIRRAAREGWRPGRASPYYVVEDPSPEGALAKARDFIQSHG